MSTNQVSNSSGNGLYMWVALLLAALLAIMTFMGYGPGGANCKPAAVAEVAAPVVAPVAAAVAPAAVPTPAPAAPAAPAAVVPAASIPAAKVYFDLDKTALPKDVDATLAEVQAYLKANGDAKAKIAGFHDPSGNKAHNEDLAKNRAKAVKTEFTKLGVAEDRLVMEKPMETTGTGDAKEARRVEVTVFKP
jgi:outer membrane protein OmpA-like peptidoglycan-associated protein